MVRHPGRTAVRLIAAALFCGCAASARAVESPLFELVPVPGGIAPLATAVDGRAAPEPARFASELPRMIYEWVEGSAPADRRIRAIAAVLDNGRQNSSGRLELVPIPLGPRFWSDVVFRRAITRENLVEAILTDRSAALLCRGLSGVDDETLTFFAGQPALIRAIYENGAAAFAAFADSIVVRNNAVALVGGALAAPLWRAVLGATDGDAAGFVRELLTHGTGRVAYVYDTLSHLDEAHRLFALGATLPESVRVARFKALVAIATSSCPEWDVRQRPFGRPPNDVGALLRTVEVTPDGHLASPATRDFWAHAFGRGHGNAAGDDADAAWLAETIVTAEVIRRASRVDQLTFAQRVFGASRPAADVLDAVSLYPRVPMLMLALERMHVRSAETYVTLARAARPLTDGSASHADQSLAQFQGALAILVRATETRRLDPARAEHLAVKLAAVPSVDGEYLGGVARWIASALIPAATAGSPPAAQQADVDPDAVLEDVVAGGPPPEPATVAWEDRSYTLDLAAAERQRIRRIRDATAAPSFAQALQGANGSLRAGRRHLREVDRETATAIKALVYAVYLGDPEGPALVGGDASARHDFGLQGHEPLETTAWAQPRDQIAPRVPRYVLGSLLNLDLAIAPLALVRIDPGAVVQPAINPNDREVFAQSVVLTNPYDLRDGDLATIARGVEAGRARVAPQSLDAIADELHMDGWRRRAMRLAAAGGADPLDYMSLPELLQLGGPSSLRSLQAWGMAARPLTGCVCTVIPVPDQWQLAIGRPQFGLLATQVPDLKLAVAIALHARHLPAALARGVLASAMQDYVDAVRPTDNGDWLALVRAARSIPDDRMDDYVAALTAGGPLVPATTARRRGEVR